MFFLTLSLLSKIKRSPTFAFHGFFIPQTFWDIFFVSKISGKHWFQHLFNRAHFQFIVKRLLGGTIDVLLDCSNIYIYCIYQTEITIWTRKTQLFYRLVFRLPKNWLRVKSIQSNVLRRVSRRNKLCLTHVAFSFAKLFSLDGYKPLASWPVLYSKPKRGRRTAEISKPFYLPEF